MNRRSSDYPIQNRLFVYLGLTVVAAAVFPPTLVVTAPTLVGWYKGAKRQQFHRAYAIQEAIYLRQAGREYDQAVKSFAP